MKWPEAHGGINPLGQGDCHARRGVVKCCRVMGDRSMHALVASLLCVLGGCEKATAPPVVDSRQVERTQAGSPSSLSVADRTQTAGASGGDRARVARFGITSPCVLHAGDSQATRHEQIASSGRVDSVVTTGTCSFNAECIRQQGRNFAGDGDVELDCRGRSCSCSLRRWFPSDASLSFSFAIEEVCSTTDLAERLLRDHCMAGLRVDGQAE